MNRKGEELDLAANYGHIIADERQVLAGHGDAFLLRQKVEAGARLDEDALESGDDGAVNIILAERAF